LLHAEGAGLQGDVVVDELAEVGVDRRDVGVAGIAASAGVLHRGAQFLQPLDGGGRFGQQVGIVVLELQEQEVEVLQRGRRRHRKAQLDAGGLGGQVTFSGVELLRGGDLAVGDPWHR
jgi:hypothetical protein